MKAEPVVHPGALLDSLILAPTGISQSMLARRLGFNQPQPVNELVRGKRGITPKMALLLERFSGGNYPAEFWLLAQLRWDLQKARTTLPTSRLAMVQGLQEAGAEASAAAARCGQGGLLQTSEQLRQ